MEIAPASSPPQFGGVRYLGECVVLSLALIYSYNGARFDVLLASPEDEPDRANLLPPGYRLDQSIEGKFLTELSDLTWGEFDEARDAQSWRLKGELAKLVAEAALSFMQQLALTPRPAPRTLHERLYHPSFTLQVLTEDGRLACRKLDTDIGLPERHPPISEAMLCAMGLNLETTDVPVVEASQVLLVRGLQGLVWLVEAGGENMVCKASPGVARNATGRELETYLKLRAAGVELRVPQLKGVVKSHRGVVGFLLSYVPHKYHSLGALLAGVKNGTIPDTEASVQLRQKWALQIEQTLAALHDLGILWHDVKTDNILIDDNGDAVVLDFGGGNTVGWVDRENYGTMEGEAQALRKILDALDVKD